MGYNSLVLKDFSGGLSRLGEERLSANEAHELAFLEHVRGRLSPFGGLKEVASRPNPDPSLNQEGIRTICEVQYAPSSAGSPPETLLLATASNFVYALVGENWVPIDYSPYDFCPRYRFVQWGYLVYFLPTEKKKEGATSADLRPPRRFDGRIYNTGTITTNASSRVVTGSGTSWLGNVGAGDTILFDFTGTAAKKFVITRVISNTSLEIHDNAGVTLTDTGYVISGVQHAGVSVGEHGIDDTAFSAKSTSVTSGGDVGSGKYRYALTFVDAKTRTETGPYDFGVVTTVSSAGSKITVSFTINARFRLFGAQASKVRFYRTFADQLGAYFYAGEIDTDFSTNTWSFVDTNADESLGDPLPDGHDSAPGDLQGLVGWNGRLFAWKGTKIRFSSVGSPEYWPLITPLSLTGEMTPALGGEIDVGPEAIEILKIEPETVSQWASSAIGDSCLIFAKGGVWRLYGRDWSDFAMAKVSNIGAINDCANYVQGMTFYVTRDGPVGIPTGSNELVRFYEKIFPPDREPFRSVARLGTSDWNKFTDGTVKYTYAELMASVGAGEWWLLSYATVDPSVYGPTRVLAIHAPTGTATLIGTDECYVPASALGWSEATLDGDVIVGGWGRAAPPYDPQYYVYSLCLFHDQGTYIEAVYKPYVDCVYKSGGVEFDQYTAKLISVGIDYTPRFSGTRVTLEILRDGEDTGVEKRISPPSSLGTEAWREALVGIEGRRFAIRVKAGADAIEEIRGLELKYVPSRLPKRRR